MKRCPDCGFRSKEALKTCPLCGVRMREDPNWNQPRYTGHVHREKGETCLLPNTGREKSARTRDKIVTERQLRRERKPSARSGRTSRQQDSSKKIAGVVIALILYALMQACSA